MTTAVQSRNLLATDTLRSLHRSGTGRGSADRIALTKRWELYQRDPVTCVAEVFGATLWSKQREILQAIATHNRVAVASCHASGKTFTAALAVLWWLYSHSPSIAVTTAPTGHQVKDLLWRQIRGQHSRAKVKMGTCITTRLDLDTDWYAVGLSTAEPDTFQGYHSPNMMIVVDEANGVDDQIYAAIEGILSTTSDEMEGTGNTRLLLIGNPVTPAGEFYDAFTRPANNYHTIEISAFDTPRFTDEPFDKRLAQSLTSPSWVEARRIAWGEESPLYLSRCLGRFPGEKADAVLAPLAWSEMARKRIAPEVLYGPVQMGVDVARMGSNLTSIAWRLDPALLGLETFSKQTVPEVAALVQSRAKMLLRTYGRDVWVAIDIGGVGAGVYDLCADEVGIFYCPVTFGARSSDFARYMTLKDEMYWNLRQWLAPLNGYPDIVWLASGVPSERAQNQLAQIRFELTARNQVRIESKDDMLKRGVPSPDEADSIALAFIPLHADDAGEQLQVAEAAII